MSRICAITGRKANIQRSRRHASGKSRSGIKAFSYLGPQGMRGVRKLKRQDINLVTVRTPLGKVKVSMKAYKTFFKMSWEEKQALMAKM